VTSELESPETCFPELSLTPNTNVYPKRDRLFRSEDAALPAVDEEQPVPAE
jgi:hypothetical protein